MSVWIHSGSATYDVKPERLVTPEDDWDVLTRTVRYSAASLIAAHHHFAKGSVHPDFSHMMVVDRDFSEIACGTGRYEGEVVYKGIADTDRPNRFQIESYGERSTYDSLISPALPGTPTPTDVSLPRLGVTVRYIATSRPDESQIGTNQTPPSPPGGSWVPPDNAFSFSTDVILSYPYGWVLEKRSAPNIPGADIWLVEDQYVYYQPWRPHS